METTTMGLYRSYKRVTEKKMETTIDARCGGKKNSLSAEHPQQ